MRRIVKEKDVSILSAKNSLYLSLVVEKGLLDEIDEEDETTIFEEIKIKIYSPLNTDEPQYVCEPEEIKQVEDRSFIIKIGNINEFRDLEEPLIVTIRYKENLNQFIILPDHA